jgi:outer membrane protein OmpU
MKKNLLANTALVAAGALASTGAFAQTKKIQIKVGGYYEQWVGYGLLDKQGGESLSDVDVQEEGEIHFGGTTTLDNGLTFGVNVQLATQVQGDQIRENYLFIRGEFGEILLGSENGAAYALGYGLPSAGVGIDSGYGCNWGADAGCFELATTQGNFARRDNDSNKIRFISPRMAGFQVGVSYAPEATQDDDGFPTEATNDGANEEGVMAAGLNYDNKFGDIRLRASGGFQYFFDVNGTSADTAYAVGTGVRIGFGGFTVAGSYHRQENRSATVDNRQTFGASVSFAEGPLGVSLGAVYGEDDGVAAAADDEQIMIELGGKYILGPGVTAKGSVFYTDRDDAGTKSDGFAVVGGIALSF